MPADTQSMFSASPDVIGPRPSDTDSTARCPRRPERFPRLSRFRLSVCRRFLLAILAIAGLAGLASLSTAVAAIEYLLCARRRRRVRCSIAHLTPGLDATATERAVRRWFLRYRSDRWLFLVSDRVPAAELRSRTVIEGAELLAEVIERGRGAVALLSHLGSHDLLPLLMAAHGYRCAGVRVREDCAARRYMRRRLQGAAPELAAFRATLTSRSPRQILRWLNEGFVVGCAVDVIPPGLERLRCIETRDAEGRARQFLSGPVRLARQSGAALIQAFLVSHPGFRYTLHVFPLDRDLDLTELAHHYYRRVFAFERTHADHASRF